MLFEAYKSALLIAIKDYFSFRNLITFPANVSQSSDLLVIFSSPGNEQVGYFYNIKGELFKTSENKKLIDLAKSTPLLELDIGQGIALNVFHIMESIVEETNYGNNLWENVDREIDIMPGWWSFFSKGRDLTLALIKIQNDFNRYGLKKEDDDRVEATIRNFRNTISDLREQLESLKEKFRLLFEENSKLKDENALLKKALKECKPSTGESEDNLKELIGEKNNCLSLISELEEENKRLRQQINDGDKEKKKLVSENERLIVRLRFTVSTIDSLIKKHDNMYSKPSQNTEKNPVVITPSTTHPQGRIEEGRSAEFFNKQAAEYRRQNTKVKKQPSEEKMQSTEMSYRC